MVIGGLLSETSQEVERRVPLLSKIPIFGNFLKRTDSVRMKTNLLIFLTPHILRTQRMLEVASVKQRTRMVKELPPGRLSTLQLRRLAEISDPRREVRSPASASASASDSGDASAKTVPIDWEVQAGASQDRARAEGIIRELAEKGYRAFVLGADDAGDGWYRVRIGGLQSYAEADAIARELIAQGVLGAFVPAQ